MRESIAQESDFGCGIACFAFAAGISYKEAVDFLGPEQAASNRFWVKDFTAVLNEYGLAYISMHLKPHIGRVIYQEGVIVLIRRPKTYPAGHYLIRHNRQWMDPWVNLPQNRNIKQAKSGFRKRLPGSPMYAITPK